MGLDNGIYIKTHNKQMYDEIQRDLANFFEYDICIEDEIEFAYWRKCWNVRRALYDISKVEEDESLPYYTFDSIEDLHSVAEWLINQFTYNPAIEASSREEIDDEDDDNPYRTPDTCKWDKSYNTSYSNGTIWSTKVTTGAQMRIVKQLTALYVWLSCHSNYKLHIDYELCWYDSY